MSERAAGSLRIEDKGGGLCSESRSKSVASKVGRQLCHVLQTPASAGPRLPFSCSMWQHVRAAQCQGRQGHSQDTAPCRQGSHIQHF